MAEEIPAMTMKPIGFVRNEVERTPRDGGDWWVETISDIVIEESLTEALDGLEKNSCIIVLYWMHRLTTDEIRLKIHPRGRQEIPLRGLFATRTPNRPNRIGVTTVRLLRRQGNVLTVKGLDALNGTPVIDVKPCIAGYDSVDDAEVSR